MLGKDICDLGRYDLSHTVRRPAGVRRSATAPGWAIIEHHRWARHITPSVQKCRHQARLRCGTCPRFQKSLKPADHRNQDIVDPHTLSSLSNLSQNFAPLLCSLHGPLVASRIESERDIDGLVLDQALVRES
jgi:hypothetical protein